MNIDKKIGIEEKLADIESLISKLEEPETTLEEAFVLYEQGIKLVKQAGEGISHVEKQMEILSGEEE
jgi:exonuclease VII small subunit